MKKLKEKKLKQEELLKDKVKEELNQSVKDIKPIKGNHDKEANSTKDHKSKTADLNQASDIRSFAPMTKEMWEKQQSVVRRVYDEDTGRTRLVRGDGEIMEEIVSEARHKEINRTATAGDGASFQANLSNKMKL